MEDISFLGYTVRPEVSKSLSVLRKTQAQTFRSLLEAVLHYIRGKDITDEEFEAAFASSELDVQSAAVAFAGTFYILRTALRKRVKDDKFANDLGDLKLPGHVLTGLTNALKKNRAELEAGAAAKKITFPQVAGMRWRVDITISSSKLSMALNPSIFLELTLSDGSKESFDVSVEKFHELRYYVARVLKDMQDLEELSILKIE
mmetsp:Transcript_19556/g.75090  ORF Transcript_19556/g.75090 Transcript_19556/m.75090 type:complete len:203 (-) Transcript_19556:73-681(-)